jgi:dihydroorotase-like cyclic amidohydrolase
MALSELPGIIDVSTRLTPSELYTGTLAALSGGVTTIITGTPVAERPILAAAILDLIQVPINCDVAFFGGFVTGAKSDGKGKVTHDFHKRIAMLNFYKTPRPYRFALKDDALPAISAMRLWPGQIAVRSEGVATTLMVIGISQALQRPIHIYNIRFKREIDLIKAAKDHGSMITCEVHAMDLFTEVGYDRTALWKNMDYVDILSSGHDSQSNTIEATLSIMLMFVRERRMSYDRLIDLVLYNPLKIFPKLQHDKSSKIFVDMAATGEVPLQGKFYSERSQSPLREISACGVVRRVELRNDVIFEDGQIIETMGRYV